MCIIVFGLSRICDFPYLSPSLRSLLSLFTYWRVLLIPLLSYILFLSFLWVLLCVFAELILVLPSLVIR